MKSAFQPKRLLATAPGGFSDFIPSVAVIDLLEIPETIEPGEYVLQYRYDSEQTPQVWNTCSGEHRPALSANPFLNARQSFSASFFAADIKILPRVPGQPQINKSGQTPLQ